MIKKDVVWIIRDGKIVRKAKLPKGVRIFDKQYFLLSPTFYDGSRRIYIFDEDCSLPYSADGENAKVKLSEKLASELKKHGIKEANGKEWSFKAVSPLVIRQLIEALWDYGRYGVKEGEFKINTRVLLIVGLAVFVLLMILR